MFPIASASFRDALTVARSEQATFPARLLADLVVALRNAAHLSTADSRAACVLADQLLCAGHVEVEESCVDRVRAVAGVQWAMEQCLGGVEFIVTPERATPLRIEPDEHQSVQRARREGLLQRLDNGQALHLVFCEDGKGTPEQDAAYTRDILDRYGPPGGPLHEHVLPFAKAGFPGALSGAFILHPTGTGSVFAFGIRAAQADKASGARSIALSFGAVDRDAAVQEPEAPSSANGMVHAWAQQLDAWMHGDCLELAHLPRRQ